MNKMKIVKPRTREEIDKESVEEPLTNGEYFCYLTGFREALEQVDEAFDMLMGKHKLRVKGGEKQDAKR